MSVVLLYNVFHLNSVMSLHLYGIVITQSEINNLADNISSTAAIFIGPVLGKLAVSKLDS